MSEQGETMDRETVVIHLREKINAMVEKRAKLTEEIYLERLRLAEIVCPYQSGDTIVSHPDRRRKPWRARVERIVPAVSKPYYNVIIRKIKVDGELYVAEQIMSHYEAWGLESKD